MAQIKNYLNSEDANRLLNSIAHEGAKIVITFNEQNDNGNVMGMSISSEYFPVEQNSKLNAVSKVIHKNISEQMGELTKTAIEEVLGGIVDHIASARGESLRELLRGLKGTFGVTPDCDCPHCREVNELISSIEDEKAEEQAEEQPIKH